MSRTLLLAECVSLAVTGQPSTVRILTISTESGNDSEADTATGAPGAVGNFSWRHMDDMDNTTEQGLTAGRAFGDVEDGILTKEQRDLAILVLERITFVILPLTFIVTICNITVFAQKSMRSSTSKYVIVLSIGQIVYVLIDVGVRIMIASFDRSIPEEYGYFAYNIYVFTWVVIVRRASYIIMCIVSLERIYAVVRPLHIKTFVLTRYPLSLAFCAFAATTIYHFYIFANLRIVEIEQPNGVTLYNFATTDFYDRNKVAMENLGVSSKILFSYIPLILLMCLNVLTLFFLRRYREVRQKMKTSSNAEEEQRKQRQMTVTILGATIGYVILSLPLELHAIVGNVHPEYNSWGSEYNIFMVFRDLAYVCHILSCFTDFLSFFLLSTAYRQTFLRIFCCGRFAVVKQRDMDSGTVVSTVSVADTDISAKI